ncbi:MAG: macrolide family glycosyltransferase [Chitinophagales bacterium]
MARIIFLNVQAYGHVNPSLAIVRELVQRGEEVIYYTDPKFETTIQKMGAVYRNYPLPFLVDHARASENAFGLLLTVLKYAEEVAPLLIPEVAAQKPDYIIHDGLCIWGKLVAHALKIPAICSIPFLVFNIRNLFMNVQNFLGISNNLVKGTPQIVQFLKIARNIDKQHHVKLYNFLLEGGAYEDFNISYTSRYFQSNERVFGTNFLFVGPSIIDRKDAKPEILEKIDGNKPLVYISLGTVMSVRQEAFYQMCFQALGDLDVQVILAIGFETKIEDLQHIPPNFLVRNYVPQLEILKHTKLFITHAGMNSVQESIYFEVPMIVIPQTFEQSMNAVRAENLGVAKYLKMKNLDSEVLKKASSEMLQQSPEMQTELQKISTSFKKAGGYKRAVDGIFHYTTSIGVRKQAISS